MPSAFTACHRGGSGPPLVCVHGFTGTWRVWELVIPMLERRHELLVPTLAGHAGGPPVEGAVSDAVLADAVERTMDEAGFETAHVVGNSLGGYVALQLAARGRAISVVAFAPAGGWAPGDDSYSETLHQSTRMQELLRAAAPHADSIARSAEGRRPATQFLVEDAGRIPNELVAHLIVGAANCQAADALIQYALREGWNVEAERVTCPLRIVWGTADRLLEWPATAARFRDDWFPQADWVVLDGVGHCPQLEIPLEAAQLITGFTAT